MSFFDKVLTFFSAIWNAILWRRTEKKSKKTTKTVEEEPLKQHDLTAVSDTERSFVDVPLHTPVTSDQVESEQRTPICNEDIHEPYAPIVAHTYDSFDEAYRKRTSSYFGTDEETTSRLSFYSEPIREEVNLREESTCHKERLEGEQVKSDENDERRNNLNEATAHEEQQQSSNEVNRVNASNPIVPDDVRRVTFTDQSSAISDQCLPESKASTPANDSPVSDEVSALNDFEKHQDLVVSSSDEKHLHKEKSQSIHENGQPLAGGNRCLDIDPNLNYLAIGDEVHLFEHDMSDFICIKDIQELETNYENHLNIRSELEDEIPCNSKSLKGLGTFSVAPVESEENCISISSGIESAPAVNSVSKTTTPSKNTNDLMAFDNYSTNYMVRSDSLVNFLPESENDPTNVQVHYSYVFHSSTMGLDSENEKDSSNQNQKGPLLEEGCLEEVMCTPRGILRLSGDYRIDDIEESTRDSSTGDLIKDFEKLNNVSSEEDDFLKEFFTDQNSLHESYYVEGGLPEITSGAPRSSDSEIFHKTACTLGTIGSLKCSEVVEVVSENVNENNNITGLYNISPEEKDSGRSIDLIQGENNSLEKEVSTPKRCDNECRRSNPCRLSQFTKFNLKNDHFQHSGHRKIHETASATIPCLRYCGEVSSKSGGAMFDMSDSFTRSPLVEKNNSTAHDRCPIDPFNQPFIEASAWPLNQSLAASKALTETNTENDDSDMFVANQDSRSLEVHGKTCSEFPADDCPETVVNDGLNDFYPFIDCSSFLFRIPEEIRQEETFNPCVGAAPSRRSGFPKNANGESLRFSEGCNNDENKYLSMNSLSQHCVGSAPLLGSRIAGEYNNGGVEKVTDECNYSHRQVAQNAGGYWSTHPGIVHSEQQHTLVGYSVDCPDNFYDRQNLNVIPTVPYVTDQSNNSNNVENISYISPYGTLEFPVLNIPLCTQSPPGFLPRGPIAPLIFPIGPMSGAPNEDLPLMVNLDGNSCADNQYPVPNSYWGGYQSDHTHNLENVNEDEDKEDSSAVDDMARIAHIENSSVCTNDDEVDSCPIPDPFFHLAENTSLHTVRSKADSYTGSLFCESLRSIISHNTDNENIFPSFSCSSVPGINPSIVLQSCDATLSNDSLPSIIVEENTYIKSVDEDYLATEKFMNDVNTALNESVLDQIQERVDLLQNNLLARGDGSMTVDSEHFDETGRNENSENDVMLRNSLGENVSINNSKLTLLDGVLGTENGKTQQDPLCWSRSELDSESADVVYSFCQELLDSLVEEAVVLVNDQSTLVGPADARVTTGMEAEPNMESLSLDNLEDIVVQHMMFIEGVPGQFRHVFSDNMSNKTNDSESEIKLETSIMAGEGSQQKEHISGKVFEVRMSSRVSEFPGNENLNRRGRRNRRGRKKPPDDVQNSDIVAQMGVQNVDESPQRRNQEQIISSRSEAAGELNTGSSHELKCQNLRADQTAGSVDELDTSKSECGGDSLANENIKFNNEVGKNKGEAEHHREEDGDDEEHNGEVASCSNNRRRRNRRKKRKN